MFKLFRRTVNQTVLRPTVKATLIYLPTGEVVATANFIKPRHAIACLEQTHAESPDYFVRLDRI